MEEESKEFSTVLNHNSYEEEVILKGAYKRRVAEEKEESKGDDDLYADFGEEKKDSELDTEREVESGEEIEVGRTYNYFYPTIFQKYLKNFHTKVNIDETVPKYLVDHYRGNYKKARRRHEIINAWRKELNIDERLNYKPMFFDLAEEYLSTIMVGRARNGEIVFCESYKPLDLELFKERGVTPRNFNDFLIFIHEYVRVKLNNDIEGQQPNPCYVILDSPTMDLKGALKKEVYRYTEINMECMENFYPTHIKKVFVAKPPNVLKHIWKAFKLVLPASLANKFYMVDSENVLDEFIDLKIIPSHLGGLKMDNDAKRNAMYRDFRNYIDSLPSEEEYMALKNLQEEKNDN